MSDEIGTRNTEIRLPWAESDGVPYWHQQLREARRELSEARAELDRVEAARQAHLRGWVKDREALERLERFASFYLSETAVRAAIKGPE